MQIEKIIKNAVARLESEGKLLTPEFYTQAFCLEASKSGVEIEDCTQIKKLSASLNKDLQKELGNYRIKTMSELARFLISKLNRTNPTQCSETLEVQSIFVKRVLQTISVLHNKEASELAKKSIEMLEGSPSTSQIDQFRQLWVNFLTTYDDTFLEKLKAIGTVDAEDLKKTIENLHIQVPLKESSNDEAELTRIASLLVASLVPSLASNVNEKITFLSQKIKDNPHLLESANIEKEIRSAIALRISLDKKSVKDMIATLDNVLDKLSLRLIEMIEKSDNSTGEIQKIKHELETYNIKSSTNFKLAHKKLFTIAVALEENTQLLSKDLKSQNEEVSLLSARVHELEEQLKAAQEDSKQDFLTKLYNKRALDEFLTIKDSEFKRYNHNFSIVMFDIDHFKSVNDTYGHDAGDAVLKAFANILKKEARKVDIVGRFGGEEFIAILSETGAEGGVTFAEKVRAHVEKSRFMYKGERIDVTVSGGVCERAKHPSFTNTINAADENLYKAKNSGRNKIVG